ncbi:MAG: tellurite resistance TerB family protein [Thiogranum sp.]
MFVGIYVSWLMKPVHMSRIPRKIRSIKKDKLILIIFPEGMLIRKLSRDRSLRDMNLQNLLDQFMGSSNQTSASVNGTPGIGGTLSKLTSNVPGGLASGAAAGGIMALLIGNKSARKFAGKAATYGGAAMLGGLAFKAYENWRQNSNPQADTPQTADESAFLESSPAFELTLVKSMIAAARADGHIDATEQQNIFKAVERMGLSTEMKAAVFELLSQPIPIDELASGVDGLEQKSEVYLASCLAIDPDRPAERTYLNQLASVLQLPQDLALQLQTQAQQAIAA